MLTCPRTRAPLAVGHGEQALRSVQSAFAQRLGLGLVRAMPRLLSVISVVGVVAMLWVGGHILLVNSAEVGWHWPYDTVHHWEEAVHDAVHDAVGAQDLRADARIDGDRCRNRFL